MLARQEQIHILHIGRKGPQLPDLFAYRGIPEEVVPPLS
jgi:hypothetical protein